MNDLTTVSFKSADGATVYADYYPAGESAVVLAHGAIYNKESWRNLAIQLNANDIAALAIDFRGYGDSTPGDRPNDKYEDILAAVKYLREQPEIRKVAVLGASMGGGAAARATIHAQFGQIDRTILLSPAPILSPNQMKGKLLYILSKKEAAVYTISEQFGQAPEPKQIIYLPGSAHGQHIFDSRDKDALTEAITEFLKY